MPGRQGGLPAALPPLPPFLLLFLLVAAAAVAAEVVEVELEVAGGLAQRYGGPRQSVLVNGALSGPEIRVRTGDTVRATVRNALLDGGTTVHWHGVLQKGTNFFDGVDGITQCAIPPGETFAYEFLAAPSGTMWYHSHTGSQYSDGLLGPLVVEAAEGSCGIFATGSSAVVEATLLLTDWDSRYSQETLYELMDPEAAAPSGRRRRTAQQAGPEQQEGGAPPGWGDIGDWPFEGALANGVALPELPEASSSGSANTSALLEAVGIAGAKRLRVICGTSMQMLAVGFGGTPFTVGEYMAHTRPRRAGGGLTERESRRRQQRHRARDRDLVPMRRGRPAGGRARGAPRRPGGRQRQRRLRLRRNGGPGPGGGAGVVAQRGLRRAGRRLRQHVFDGCGFPSLPSPPPGLTEP